MPSRRAVIGGTVAVAALGGLAGQVRVGSVASWSPPADTWPLQHYGPANTAANPDATVPADPSVTWTRNVGGSEFESNLVVGAERVYAAGDGVVALDRGSGERSWTKQVAGGPLALRDGTLYVTPGDDAPADASAALRAFDAAEGGERWATPDVSEADGVLVADGTVVVGSEAGLAAYGTAAGGEQWRLGSFPPPAALVHRDRLFVAEAGVARLRARRLVSVALGDEPTSAWRTERLGTPLSLAASGELLVAGFLASGEHASSRGLAGLDTRDGTVRWTALPAREATGPVRVGALSTTGDRCVAAVRRGPRQDRRHEVVCLRTTDGAERWRRQVDGRVVALAIAGGTVLVATAADRVRALRLADGSERWRRRAFEVRALAPVDGAVFVATGGRVLAWG